MKKLFFRLSIGLFFLLGLISVFGYFRIYQPFLQAKALTAKGQLDAQELVTAIKNSDLGLAKAKISVLDSDLDQVRDLLSGFSWMQSLPLAKNYYADANSVIIAADELLSAGIISIDAITPYADLLGLKGVDAGTLAGKTAQDRINFLVKTIELLDPQMDEISQAVDKAKIELDKIDPNRYPQHFQGKPIRGSLVQGISMIDQAASLLSDARPFLQSAPYMLGWINPENIC